MRLNSKASCDLSQRVDIVIRNWRWMGSRGGKADDARQLQEKGSLAYRRTSK
jgi:hypothetical protein